jgi:hypothetical protein
MGLFKHKTFINNDGYKQHYNPKSPDARNNGYAPIHRDVARKKISRDILPTEVVHHRDGNKLNNKRKNLEVMTQSEHYKIHNKIK